MYLKTIHVLLSQISCYKCNKKKLENSDSLKQLSLSEIQI